MLVPRRVSRKLKGIWSKHPAVTLGMIEVLLKVYTVNRYIYDLRSQLYSKNQPFEKIEKIKEKKAIQKCTAGNQTLEKKH